VVGFNCINLVMLILEQKHICRYTAWAYSINMYNN
jgi:hypothetical protein